MKKNKKRSAIGFYDVKLLCGSYLPPFLAVDDDEALNAVVEMARTVPSFQRCYVRHIGTYCVDTGEIQVCESRILQMKKDKINEVQN